VTLLQTLFTPDNSPIRPEFRGKFRSFRQRCMDATYARELERKAFEEVLRARFKRIDERIPRKEFTDAWLNRIEAAGQFGQIHMTAYHSKKEFRYHDVRVGATSLENPDWDNGEEPGIGVTLYSLRAEKKPHFTIEAATRTQSVLLASSHTGARFFQRAFGNADNDALMADLTQVAAAVCQRKTDLGDYFADIKKFVRQSLVVPTDNGTWRGVFEPIRDDRNRLDLVLNVRTFI
jgi:hypothetical protein